MYVIMHCVSVSNVVSVLSVSVVSVSAVRVNNVNVCPFQLVTLLKCLLIWFIVIMCLDDLERLSFFSQAGYFKEQRHSIDCINLLLL